MQTRLGGRLARYTIGRHGAPWTPDQARRRAILILGQLAEGKEPELPRQEKRRAAVNISQLCDLYLAEGCRLKKASTIACDVGRIERHVKPLIGSRRIKDIKRRDVERLMHDIADGRTIDDVRTRPRGRAIVTGGKGAASRTIGMLGGILQFAVERGLIDHNPARGIKRFPDKRCERFLSTEELSSQGATLSEAERLGMENLFALAALRFLILTGCRKSEAVQLQWSWIDFPNSVVRYPDSKTGAKVQQLGAPALELLSNLTRTDASPFVFRSNRNDGPIVSLQDTWENIRASAGLEDVRLHDLRHSFASIAAAGGDSLIIIGKLLGHRTPTATARYAHLSDDPLRHASDRIGAKIAAALEPRQETDVTPLSQRS